MQFVKSIEAPDRIRWFFVCTILRRRSCQGIAHPANFIYAKKYLDQDVNWYKQNTMGSGPFKLKEYVRGSSLELERNPNYWKKGLPYMDGVKYFMIKDDGARAKSIRSDRTDVEFRGFAPVEAETIKNQLGDKADGGASWTTGPLGSRLQC